MKQTSSSNIDQSIESTDGAANAVRRKAVNGDEQDVYYARRRYVWTQRAGAVKAVKRRTHKRERRAAKSELRGS